MIENLYKLDVGLNCYSQNGEELYLREIFKHIGTTNKYFVDLGSNDGIWYSNTKLLSTLGWDGLLVDGKTFPGVYKAFITLDNINHILSVNKVPVELDLLSIDLDGNDYWILDKILENYRPRVIVSEYNSEHTDCKTISYDPEFVFYPDDYYGYTLLAGEKLAKKHGYTIIFSNSRLNLYYLRNDISPGYVPKVKNEYHRHWGPNDKSPINKKWHEL